MSDQGQWFKLWIGADEDPDLGNLSLEDFGRWCKLGIYLKKHGNNGSLVIKEPAIPLQQRFRVSTFESVVSVLQKFPHCRVERRDKSSVSPETTLTVTYENWLKYQGDFSTNRVRKFREMKRSKRRGEERRREEKREEDKNPLSSAGTEAKSVVERLLKKMRENNPTYRVPGSLEKWVREADLMLRVDKRPVADVFQVIDWCQADSFWKSNILSVKKLREKFDQLSLRMKEPSRNGGKIVGAAKPTDGKYADIS